MSTETQRAEFIAAIEHAPELAHINCNIRFRQGTDPDFHYPEVRLAWKAWQAAQSSQAAEIEALRKDAARYRWLRRSENPFQDAERERLVKFYADEFLDSAIDAAIQTKEAS